MSIDAAPVANQDEEDAACDECEGTYVLYDGDKLCRRCGYIAGSGHVEDDEDGWRSWLDHRRENYSGWYGEERIKMVGGFISAYDFGEDLLLD